MSGWTRIPTPGARATGALLVLLLSCATVNAAGPKTLHYAIEIAETGFDPAEINDLYSRDLTRNLFDSPLRFAYLAPPGTVEISTADRMPEISADFKTLTVHLKKGIYFIDDPAFNGKKRELTAEDYVYSYKRIYDPHWNSPVYSAIFEPVGLVGMEELRQEAIKTGHFNYDTVVEGLKTLDRYTFQIKLLRASPRFYQNLADPSQMSAVAREVVEKYGDGIMEHPVGTGPFKLVEWRRSSKMVFERNPDYREDIFHVEADPTDAGAQAIAKALDGKRLPLIDRVEVSVIEESQPRWLSFLNAEYDFLDIMPRDLGGLALPNNQLAPNLVKKHVGYERVPQIDVTYVIYNMDNAVVGGYTPAKIALRRALSLALDTPEIVRTFYKFQAVPAQSCFMPDVYGYDPNLRTENGVTDVARARALLDTYGYAFRDGARYRSNPDGSPLVLDIMTEPDQRSRVLDEIMKKSYDALGVEVRFNPGKWPDNFKAARAGNYVIWSLGGSASGPDPSGNLISDYGPASGGENLARFKLAAYDALYLKQDAMPDGPERLQVLHQMNMLLTAYAPSKFIANRFVTDMYYPWLHYYRRWPFSQGQFWQYVDIDQAAQPPGLR